LIRTNNTEWIRFYKPISGKSSGGRRGYRRNRLPRGFNFSNVRRSEIRPGRFTPGFTAQSARSSAG
jgi:hypothetical protein